MLLNSPYKEGWVKLQVRRGESESKGEKELEKEKEKMKGDGGFPIHDGDVVRSAKRDTRKSDGMPATFWQRLWWATRLSTTSRYTGWSSEAKNVPASVPPSYPRWYAP